MADADFETIGRVERRNESKAVIDLPAASSLNKARISSASSNVNRLITGVIAIARLVFAKKASASGVPM
jgi:hypothetical protein